MNSLTTVVAVAVASVTEAVCEMTTAAEETAEGKYVAESDEGCNRYQ